MEAYSTLGPRPDEVALVHGARKAGIVFKARRVDKEQQRAEVIVSGPPGRPDRTFSILSVIEFTAERKRMSVICEVEGQIHCITKGADVVISPLLVAPLTQTEEQQLLSFSQKGLRTLVVASVQIDALTFCQLAK